MTMADRTSISVQFFFFLFNYLVSLVFILFLLLFVRRERSSRSLARKRQLDTNAIFFSFFLPRFFFFFNFASFLFYILSWHVSDPIYFESNKSKNKNEKGKGKKKNRSSFFVYSSSERFQKIGLLAGSLKIANIVIKSPLHVSPPFLPFLSTTTIIIRRRLSPILSRTNIYYKFINN